MDSPRNPIEIKAIERSKYASGVSELISLFYKREAFSTIIPLICNGQFTDYEGAWGLGKIIYDKSSGYVEKQGSAKDKEEWGKIGSELDDLSKTITGLRMLEGRTFGPMVGDRQAFVSKMVSSFVSLHSKITKVSFDVGLTVEMKTDLSIRKHGEEDEPDV